MTSLDRRHILSGLAASAAVALAGPDALARRRGRLFERLRQPIGLQFGLLGNDAGRDLDAAFAQVAEIGFREVELSNLMGLKPAELAAAAARAGVKIASLHLPLMTMGGLSMMSDPDMIGEVMGTLGAKWAIAPILLIPPTFRPIPGQPMEIAVGRAVAGAGETIWKQSAEVLNARAAALAPHGIGIAYHNHNLDFAPVETATGRTTGWDVLARETDRELVYFEIDVGWIDLAGLDPVPFLDSLRGRVRLIHVRDIARERPYSFDISMTSPAVGTGRLDWARILPAAHRAGARHFIVEQDPTTGVSRIDALGESFRYLSRLRG